MLEAVHVLRNIKKAEPYAIILSDMLVRIMVDGDDIRTVVLDAATKIGLKNF